MSDQEWVVMTKGVRRRIPADGEKLMLVYVELEPHARLPLHNHVHEQISFVVSGTLEFTLDGKKIIVGPHESLLIPSMAMHDAAALDEPVVVVDTFSPPREDFRKK